MSNRLEIRGLRAGYGSLSVVHGIDLEVGPGEVAALLGANGAGKTTTLLTIAGILPRLGGDVLWDGREAVLPAHLAARSGFAFVGENAVFRQLTVAGNLRLGRGRPQRALELFPELEPLSHRPAGLLSGGEQQILAMARALAAEPSLLLLDELSLGLAPLVVNRLMDGVRRAARDGAAVLLVEQQARRALAVADRGYLMNQGRITLRGTAAELTAALTSGGQGYFGTSTGDQAPEGQ